VIRKQLPDLLNCVYYSNYKTGTVWQLMDFFSFFVWGGGRETIRLNVWWSTDVWSWDYVYSSWPEHRSHQLWDRWTWAVIPSL